MYIDKAILLMIERMEEKKSNVLIAITLSMTLRSLESRFIITAFDSYSFFIAIRGCILWETFNESLMIRKKLRQKGITGRKGLKNWIKLWWAGLDKSLFRREDAALLI